MTLYLITILTKTIQVATSAKNEKVKKHQTMHAYNKEALKVK